MKRISILGATGSVGQNTIDLIRRAPGAYQVVALTGGHHIDQLARDAIDLGAEVAVTAHDDLLVSLREALRGSKVEAAAGKAALIEAASRPAQWVMSAIVGAAGLAPGLAALEQGATLALANKESLVTAGVAEASSHPNWAMGQRITIDSASMFNKAMEMIEAREFFGFAPDQIEVLIHPQSLVHALVGFCDGALMAHVGPPDMRHAIGYALNWPQRQALPVAALDLAAIGTLEFRPPDPERYPALRPAREVMQARGLSGAVFNAAKERALDHFIAGRIGFTDMNIVVEEVLTALHDAPEARNSEMTLDVVAHMDHLARKQADLVVSQRKTQG